MLASLSSVVDNLSKFYRKKNAKDAKKEEKSVCDFIDLENNKLNYECKDVKKIVKANK